MDAATPGPVLTGDAQPDADPSALDARTSPGPGANPVEPVDAGARKALRHRLVPSDRAYRVLLGLGGLVALAAFVAIAYTLVRGSAPALRAFGFRFLTSTSWDLSAQDFGALPYLYGTVGSSLLALTLAVPVAIGTAVALVFLLPRSLATPIGIMVELLAAVPSIIFGVWGFAVIVPFVRDLATRLRIETFGPSLLAAGLVLAVMILPILTAVARDMLRAVATSQRDAALALGATPWEVTWRVVIPASRNGLVAASLLALGRAVGETMAVIMVIGNQPVLEWSLFKPAATLASTIANEFGDPSGELHRASLVALGLVLLGVSLSLNLLARRVTRRFTRTQTGGKP